MSKRPKEMQKTIEKALNKMYYDNNMTNLDLLKKKVDDYFLYNKDYKPITKQEIRNIIAK